MGSSASVLAAGITTVHAAAPAASPAPLDAPTWVWGVTLGGLAVLLLLDLVIVDRKPHEVTTGEAAAWVSFYVACAIAFGLGVWVTAGHASAIEFFTGYVTEYSLSVDNLFVFMLIVGSFAVPRIHQHRVLLIGIVIALVMRGMFIAAGSALIENFVWIFFLFGAFLLWTAAGMVRDDGSDSSAENVVVRWTRKVFRVTGEYHGARSVVKIDGKRWLTPMCVVIIAIGSADLLFAVDSIPAIFGITQAPFLVFTANAFALMGLRQLYFLIGGLMRKLVYLNKGLAVLLAFIGGKLILHALDEYGVTPDWFDLNNWQSLVVIIAVLVVTALASLWRSRHDAAPSTRGEGAAEQQGSGQDSPDQTAPHRSAPGPSGSEQPGPGRSSTGRSGPSKPGYSSSP
jgi:tellurite resistance protein TerC